MNQRINLKEKKRIIIGAMLIAVIILLFIFVLGKQSKGIVSETTQQSMIQKEELTQEIIGVQEYLTQLEGNVLTNQEALETIENYEGYHQKLEVLKESITKVERLIETYEKQTQVERETTKQDLLVITEKITDIKDNITLIQKEIGNIKNSMETNHEETTKHLSNIQESIEKLEENLRVSYESIMQMLEELKEENASQQKELLEMLTQVESILSELIESKLEEVLSALSKQIQEGVFLLQIQMEEDIAYLSERMDGLHSNITDAQTTLSQLLANLHEEQKEEIQKGFEGVKISLEEITLEFRETHTEIKNLILKVQETQVLYHTEMLTVLGSIESGMEELNIQNFNEVKNQYTNLINIVNTGDTGLREYLTSMSVDLKQKFDSVFLSVSDGKKKLASALLTKGVNCREDATFTEIYEAILAIPQQLVIGVQQIPGTISYDYHYHVDASGKQLHTTTNATSGGCYSIPVYHAHTSGCYTTRNCGGKAEERTYMTEGCNCGPNAGGGSRCAAHGCYFEPPSAMYPSGCAHCYCPKSREWVCTVCGRRTGGSVCSNSKTVLNCSKTGSTVEHYRVGCGLSDGQIIGAHIVYERSKGNKMQTIPIEKNVDIEIEEMLPSIPPVEKPLEVPIEEPTKLPTQEPTEVPSVSDNEVEEAPTEVEIPLETEEETKEDTTIEEDTIEETTGMEAESIDEEI